MLPNLSPLSTAASRAAVGRAVPTKSLRRARTRPKLHDNQQKDQQQNQQQNQQKCGAADYCARSGYWATADNSVYDVVVFYGDTKVAVVGFSPSGGQYDGAVFWQGGPRTASEHDKAAVQRVAREFARQQTGWTL